MNLRIFTWREHQKECVRCRLHEWGQDFAPCEIGAHLKAAAYKKDEKKGNEK